MYKRLKSPEVYKSGVDIETQFGNVT